MRTKALKFLSKTSIPKEKKTVAQVMAYNGATNIGFALLCFRFTAYEKATGTSWNTSIFMLVLNEKRTLTILNFSLKGKLLYGKS